jgi:type IV pilus assembly protein PilE
MTPVSSNICLRLVREEGFTLVELLIAVAVTGILAAIAYPSYTEYVRRGNITEAITELAEYQVKMEQASHDNGNYGAGTCAVGLSNDTKYFTLSCSLGSGGTTYVATATGKAAMQGYTYTINEEGLRRTTAFVGASALPANCWMTKKGECL